MRLTRRKFLRSALNAGAVSVLPVPALGLQRVFKSRNVSAGGWTNRGIISRFADYVQTVAQTLGDRVSDWLLFNEPTVFADLGYLEGRHAPGRKSLLDFFHVTHVVNLAQGEGFRALKAVRPASRVGTAFNMTPCEPASDSEEDKVAAERVHAIANVWFVEPALFGRYPKALTFLSDTMMGSNRATWKRRAPRSTSSASISITAPSPRLRARSREPCTRSNGCSPRKWTAGTKARSPTLVGKSGPSRSMTSSCESCATTTGRRSKSPRADAPTTTGQTGAA